MRATLESALGDRTRLFEVDTLVAAVNCCSRPWTARVNMEQTYVGFVRAVNDDGFELTNMGVGTVSYHVRIPWSAEPIVRQVS